MTWARSLESQRPGGLALLAGPKESYRRKILQQFQHFLLQFSTNTMHIYNYYKILHGVKNEKYCRKKRFSVGNLQRSRVFHDFPFMLLQVSKNLLRNRPSHSPIPIHLPSFHLKCSPGSIATSSHSTLPRWRGSRTSYSAISASGRARM